MDNISWDAYYQRMGDLVLHIPENDSAEVHRCLAAESVMPRAGIPSLLDVGCGDGYFCHWIAHRRTIGRVVGTDISATRIARARTLYPEVDEFVESAANRLRFGDDTFAVATAIEVLEHLQDPMLVLREIGRVAHTVVITVPDRQDVRMWVCPHCLRQFPVSGHLHRFDVHTIARIAEEAGLRIEETRTYHPNFFEDSGSRFLRVSGRLLTRRVREFARRKGMFLAARMVKNVSVANNTDV